MDLRGTGSLWWNEDRTFELRMLNEEVFMIASQLSCIPSRSDDRVVFLSFIL